MAAVGRRNLARRIARSRMARDVRGAWMFGSMVVGTMTIIWWAVGLIERL